MQSTYYCPSCQAPVAYGQDSCRNCGAVLTWDAQQLYHCPSCASVVTYGRVSCPSCGARLTWEQQTSLSQATQSYGDQTGYTQQNLPQQTTQGLRQQASGQQRRRTRPAGDNRRGRGGGARPRKPSAVITLAMLLTVIVAGGAVILGLNWAALTTTNPSSGATPQSPAPFPGEELAIRSFTAGPPTIAPGQSSTLQWNTSGALSVSIDHGVGTVAAAGSSEVSPTENITYTLTATDKGGSISKSTTVKIIPATLPVISSFTVTPSNISAGQSATLQWNVTGASFVSIDRGVGTVPTSGSTPVSPAEATTYMLTAGSPAGSVSASTTVTLARAGLPLVSAFSASPGAINGGQASILKWNVTGATSVSIDHGVGAVEPTGSSAVSPSENTTYTLTATGSSGSTTATAAIAVSPSRPPVIMAFTATPSAITAGQNVTLQWTVTGATSVSLNRGIGTVPATGTYPVAPSENTTYILTASSGGGPVTASALVTMVNSGTPSIATFTAVPGVISVGQYAELRWNVTRATSISIDQGIGQVPLSGTMSVWPTAHTTYTLTATSSGGSAKETTTVTVSQSSVPVISLFTASPATIRAGDPVTLQWSVSGATSVNIDPGAVAVSQSGTSEMKPTENTTYTLTATGNSAPATRAATVTVLPAGMPMITSFTATPSTVAAGQDFTLQWNVTGANSVSIDHGIGSGGSTGSATDTASENTTYTLTATGSAGQATLTATVTVTH